MSGRSWKWMEWQPKAAKLEPLAHNAISQQFCATAIGSNNSQAGIGIGSRQSNNILNAKGKRRVVTETLHMQGAALSDLSSCPYWRAIALSSANPGSKSRLTDGRTTPFTL